MNNEANPLRFIDIEKETGKPRQEFTRDDLVDFIVKNGINLLNFRYVGGDGRLKTLNFVVRDRRELERVLTLGERVDGSSLFRFVDPGMSDLYVVPRYRTAFVNPFSKYPAVDVLCSYFLPDGTAFGDAPEHVLAKAHRKLQADTGMTLEALGELEFYILGPKSELYPAEVQRGYHASAPFSKYEDLRREAMLAIAMTGGKVKYAHSEVGFVRYGELDLEQNEIEFLPTSLEEAADQIVLARWILRMLGYRHGVNITFAPKVLVGHAGSGLHIHSRLVKDGINMIVGKEGLSKVGLKLIGGYLKLAPSLTAFGNTIPISYLRLVPHQEAPTSICWGYRNRSALIRVPLAWNQAVEMHRVVNPEEKSSYRWDIHPQTVEFRAPDGSANVHLLLAGMAVAASHGLRSDDSVRLAEELFVDKNIFKDPEAMEKLPRLPASCWESAELLQKQRHFYEEDGVFSPQLIDWTIQHLKSFNDKGLSEKLYRKDREIEELVRKFIHYP